MKILLDAMMPREIAEALRDHEVVHAAERGWSELSNGKLLSAAEAEGFIVLLTKDANMPFQQNLQERNIAVIVLRPRTQDRDDLLALAPKVGELLQVIVPSTVATITQDS